MPGKVEIAHSRLSTSSYSAEQNERDVFYHSLVIDVPFLAYHGHGFFNWMALFNHMSFFLLHAAATPNQTNAVSQKPVLSTPLWPLRGRYGQNMWPRLYCVRLGAAAAQQLIKRCLASSSMDAICDDENESLANRSISLLLGWHPSSIHCTASSVSVLFPQAKTALLLTHFHWE